MNITVVVCRVADNGKSDRIDWVLKDLRRRAKDPEEYSHPVGARVVLNILFNDFAKEAKTIHEVKDFIGGIYEEDMLEITRLTTQVYLNGIVTCMKNAVEDKENQEYFMERAEEYRGELLYQIDRLARILVLKKHVYAPADSHN